MEIGLEEKGRARPDRADSEWFKFVEAQVVGIGCRGGLWMRSVFSLIGRRPNIQRLNREMAASARK